MAGIVDGFLAHYGVKGMRWGIRREPKPVSAEVQSRRDARAKKFQIRADLAQTRINELTAQSGGSWVEQINRRDQISELKTARDRDLKDAQRKREGKLSSAQRKLAIGATIVAGVLVTKAVITAADSGDINRAIIKGKETLSGQKHEWKKNGFLSRDDFDVDDIQSAVVSKINPDYGKIGSGMNCRRATFAYEMRRRGFDVAATKSTLATGQSAAGLFNATNPNDKVGRGVLGLTRRVISESRSGDTTFMDYVTKGSGLGKETIQEVSASRPITGNAASIFNKLSKMPDGARGELAVKWANVPAAHSIAWEIVKGKPAIIDAQMNKIMLNPEDFARVYPNLGAAAMTRLDNIELNGDFLLRWLKDA